MTLQQLKYVLAIDRHRSFARAAAEFDITQPTLSALLSKLEDELGIRIFERSNKSVTPTAIGERIIRQAALAVDEAEKIPEIVAEHKNEIGGDLSLAVGPTIAPYIVPTFIKRYTSAYPGVNLTINEYKGDTIIKALLAAETDAGIALSGKATAGIKEIPLYTEPFWVYLAEDCLRRLPVFSPANLEHEKMWIMKESQCMRESAFSFCKARNAPGQRMYEAGSIDTLIRIVDLNGGFTIIPEMHLQFLSEEQKRNIRPITGEYASGRRVSLYVRTDFIRHRMLESIIGTLRSFIPRRMTEKPE